MELFLCSVPKVVPIGLSTRSDTFHREATAMAGVVLTSPGEDFKVRYPQRVQCLRSSPCVVLKHTDDCVGAAFTLAEGDRARRALVSKLQRCRGEVDFGDGGVAVRTLLATVEEQGEPWGENGLVAVPLAPLVTGHQLAKW